jgi:hypothetical protein
VGESGYGKADKRHEHGSKELHSQAAKLLKMSVGIYTLTKVVGAQGGPKGPQKYSRHGICFIVNQLVEWCD